ncbi:DUF4080 domain-containing protein, partial [Desulfobulbus sp. F1]|nr:DUF4080 domain-containing protein [Desulfobulbus sp. F1]
SELHEFSECVEFFYNSRFFRSIWQYLLQSGEKPSSFFQALLDLCRAHNFFRLAHTQVLMNKLLVELAQQRKDGPLLLELLRYDWLRCGQRSLPDNLASSSQSELRDRLRRDLPQEKEGLFSTRSRTEFLKHSVFLELSGQAMALLGLGKSPAVLAFLPEQSGGVMKFNPAVVVVEC